MRIYEFSKGYDKIFPQANDIYKVIQIVVLQKIMDIDEDEIMSRLEISSTRQIHYYRKAAAFLGLLDGENRVTKVGAIFADQSTVIQLELMVYFILSIDIFYSYFITRDKQKIIDEISRNYGYNNTTATRRFSTLESWIDWCDIVISDYKIKIDGVH